jgi:selenide,water dikinase
MKRLLLIGGGHSHVEVLRRFARRPEPGTHMTLISPQKATAYSGMIPGFIAGHYRQQECYIDLIALAHRAKADFVQASVNGLHLDARLAFCVEGQTIRYDVASIDIGSRPATLPTPGADINAVGIKPIDAFLRRWEALAAAGTQIPRGYRIVVIGGGAGGVESLLAMQYRLQLAGARELRFAMVTETAEVLPTHAGAVRSAFRRVLSTRGVELHCGRRVVQVLPRSVVLAGGTELAADWIVWATGAGAPAWPAACGLACDRHGFVVVNAALQSLNRPEIFAAGDIAEMPHSPRPKSGVYAVRQGPPLAENLRRALRGEALITHRLQRQALALISTGDRYAIASRGWLTLRGQWVWRWKDRIDRRFMQRYA